jgi:hypothetical protein
MLRRGMREIVHGHANIVLEVRESRSGSLRWETHVYELPYLVGIKAALIILVLLIISCRLLHYLKCLS